MIAVLYSYPQVYVDIACKRLGDAAAALLRTTQTARRCRIYQRIMWGSDQMVWPRAIAVAIETIQTAPFVSEDQKRDIFYNNAARFLRSSAEQIAKHHGR